MAAEKKKSRLGFRRHPKLSAASASMAAELRAGLKLSDAEAVNEILVGSVAFEGVELESLREQVHAHFAGLLQRKAEECQEAGSPIIDLRHL